jgi:3'-phosphoadenosine 5'-phosphosulfate sulfotransferase (PAPS reductase)/FAD synthetase
MENPYLITGPALISFSGGRTSGYMLHQIVQAHGGKLPSDVRVAFANTGKEREETLRFVHECGSRWEVDIQWLEWRDHRRKYLNKESAREESYELVGFNSASRNGEPFAALVAGKSYLPNWQARFCTQHLKIQVLNEYAQDIGFVAGKYAEVIGLRYDEGHRIFKGIANAEKFGRLCLYPLSKAKVTKADVMAFWSAQPFDLGLEPWEGNCDLCFLKGRGLRKRIIRDDPSRADWWAEQERLTGGFFDKRDRYAGLLDEVKRSPTLFDDEEIEEYDVECGLHCAPGEAA